DSLAVHHYIERIEIALETIGLVAVVLHRDLEVGYLNIRTVSLDLEAEDVLGVASVDLVLYIRSVGRNGDRTSPTLESAAGRTTVVAGRTASRAEGVSLSHRSWTEVTSRGRKTRRYQDLSAVLGLELRYCG